MSAIFKHHDDPAQPGGEPSPDRLVDEALRHEQNQARQEASRGAAVNQAAENESRRADSEAAGRRQAGENELRRQAAEAEGRRQREENEARQRAAEEPRPGG